MRRGLPCAESFNKEKQWSTMVIYEGITGDPRTRFRSTYYTNILDVTGRTLPLTACTFSTRRASLGLRVRKSRDWSSNPSFPIFFLATFHVSMRQDQLRVHVYFYYYFAKSIKKVHSKGLF